MANTKHEPKELTRDNLAAFIANNLKAVGTLRALSAVAGVRELQIGAGAILEVLASLGREFGIDPDLELTPHCDCPNCVKARENMPTA